MSNVKQVTATSFAAEILQSPVPVLADFWAPWCGPCRALAPIIDAVEQALLGKAKVVKINVDEQPELAVQFGVQSIPTLIIFKGGTAVERMVGAQPKDVLVKRVLAQ
jgi:thioredoxin 1